jgi:hypothetical protein
MSFVVSNSASSRQQWRFTVCRDPRRNRSFRVLRRLLTEFFVGGIAHRGSRLLRSESIMVLLRRPGPDRDYRPAWLAIELCSSCHGGGLVGPAEAGAIGPHAMEEGPSLRAKATRAFFAPRRLAIPQSPALERRNAYGTGSITPAASCRAVQTIRSPTLLIKPVTSISGLILPRCQARIVDRRRASVGTASDH